VCWFVYVYVYMYAGAVNARASERERERARARERGRAILLYSSEPSVVLQTMRATRVCACVHTRRHGL